MENDEKLSTNEIKTVQGKTMALIVALLMMTSMFAIFEVQSASATTPTYVFLYAKPNPVGVDQEVYISFWTSSAAPLTGITVTVSKPDGTTDTLGPFTEYSSGTGYTTYTPTMEGTYYLQVTVPAQNTTFPGSIITPETTVNYEGSTSVKEPLTVQSEPITPYPETPLPTGYWQRPINSMNRDWSAISGDWLMTAYDAPTANLRECPYNPYTTAPTSAHIVWAKPFIFGGIAGGASGTISYYSGPEYQQRFTPCIIMQGKLFYNVPTALDQNQGGSAQQGGVNCVDLRTGELIWHQNITVDMGQNWYFNSVNQHGIYPFLWYMGVSSSFAAGSLLDQWTMYDANNGLKVLTLQNAETASSAITFGPQGELLQYVIDGANDWIALWNSTVLFENIGFGVTEGLGGWWRPVAGTYNWTSGIQWNVTIPHVDDRIRAANINSWRLDMDSGVLLTTSSGTRNFITDVAYDTDTGQMLWAENRTWYEGTPDINRMGAIGEGVYTEFDKIKLTWTGYNALTGQKIWGPTDPVSAWGSIGHMAYGIAYGRFFAVGSDGIAHCYNVTTGKLLWTWKPYNKGFEAPTSFALLTIADQKLYLTTGEEYLGQPSARGNKLYCIDAVTGQGLWNVSGQYAQNSAVVAIADGYAMTNNCEDNQIYCFGKGLTATTVSASPKVSVYGNSVLIEGTVTDQSPGQTCLGIPAAGTPAIADEDMAPWMEYLYMQQPKPANATGVEVSLDVLDANGNYRNIGVATSDANGAFSFVWEPDIPGKYTVVATFAGSESYWRSYAETAFNVDEAPAATLEPTPAPQSAADLYFVPAVIGLFVAIIIVGVVMVLMLRKR